MQSLNQQPDQPGPLALGSAFLLPSIPPHPPLLLKNKTLALSFCPNFRLEVHIKITHVGHSRFVLLKSELPGVCQGFCCYFPPLLL